jgi:phosphohistidine phosphatase
MNVYLARHGAAVELGQKGVRRDADRMLSDEGVEKTRVVAAGIARITDGDIARVAASPLVRAVETARIFSAATGLKDEPEVLPQLLPGAEGAIEWLAQQPRKSILLVGHMPDLCDLASRLLCTNCALRATFKKAAVMCISFDGHTGEGLGCLEWMLQPSVFRRAG